MGLSLERRGSSLALGRQFGDSLRGMNVEADHISVTHVCVLGSR